MHYLKKYISGKARECIEGYFLYTSDSTYEEAKAVLDKRFGEMFILQIAYREKLEKFPKIAPRDSAGLRRYADFLRQCLSASRVIICLPLWETYIGLGSVYVRPSVRSASLVRAICPRILNIEFSKFFPK